VAKGTFYELLGMFVHDGAALKLSEYCVVFLSLRLWNHVRAQHSRVCRVAGSATRDVSKHFGHFGHKPENDSETTSAKASATGPEICELKLT
jgi:hypothetical protein